MNGTGNKLKKKQYAVFKFSVTFYFEIFHSGFNHQFSNPDRFFIQFNKKLSF